MSRMPRRGAKRNSCLLGGGDPSLASCPPQGSSKGFSPGPRPLPERAASRFGLLHKQPQSLVKDREQTTQLQSSLRLATPLLHTCDHVEVMGPCPSTSWGRSSWPEHSQPQSEFCLQPVNKSRARKLQYRLRLSSSTKVTSRAGYCKTLDSASHSPLRNQLCSNVSAIQRVAEKCHPARPLQQC